MTDERLRQIDAVTKVVSAVARLLVCAVALTAAGCGPAFWEGYDAVQNPALAVYKDVRTPPPDMTFVPNQGERFYPAGTATPFDVHDGVEMYKKDLPNRPCEILGQVEFTFTSVGYYERGSDFLAAKVKQVGGNGAVLTGAQWVDNGTVDVGGGVSQPIRINSLQALVIKLH